MGNPIQLLGDVVGAITEPFVEAFTPDVQVPAPPPPPPAPAAVTIPDPEPVVTPAPAPEVPKTADPAAPLTNVAPVDPKAQIVAKQQIEAAKRRKSRKSLKIDLAVPGAVGAGISIPE